MTSPGGVHGPPTHFPIGRGWTAAACTHTRRRSGLPSPRCSYATPAGAVHLSICRLRFVVRLSPAGAASGRRRPRPHDMGAARGARAQGARDALANVRLADWENTRPPGACQFPARTAPPRTTHGSSPRKCSVRTHARPLARLLGSRASRIAIASCLCMRVCAFLFVRARRAPRASGRRIGDT